MICSIIGILIIIFSLIQGTAWLIFMAALFDDKIDNRITFWMMLIPFGWIYFVIQKYKLIGKH